MTFYLKYRPQTLEELDSESVRISLKKIIDSGALPHALLFSGPKGTGKTSAARIIAKIANCEKNAKKLKDPCGKCDQCRLIAKGANIDVIELDAASHRGIEDARALKDAIKLAPAKARKKVYIIDEAHMLTAEASNALLKTLEEPPEHVMLILATTNAEKLIETIRSRATQIVFKKATTAEIVRSLERPVKGEKIKIGAEVLELIAAKSQGSFRDAVKTLEQLVAEKIPLNAEKVGEYLSGHTAFDKEELISALIAKDAKKGLELIEEAAGKGVAMRELTGEVLQRFREALLTKMGVAEAEIAELTPQELVTLIGIFSQAGMELPSAIIEQLPLELAVVKWCGEEGKSPQIISLPPTPEGKETPKIVVATGKSAVSSQTKTTDLSDEVWHQILTQVRPINTSIEALLRAARPAGFDGQTLTLAVYYRFHKERLEEGVYRKILEDVVASVLGRPVVRVVCVLAEPPAKVVPREEKKEAVLTEGEDKDIIKIAEEVFGN